MKQLLLFVLIVILASSCARSLSYSPSVNLPTKTLSKGEFDLQAGGEMFPESRPEEVTNNTSIGVHGTLSYGVSESFNIGVKSWLDSGNDPVDSRLGFSLNAQFIKEKSPESRWLILPRIGIVNFGDGYGVGNSFIYQKEQGNNFSWYSGFGVGWGFSELNKVSYNSNAAPRLPFGYLVMGHLGLSYNLTNSFRLNCELNPLYQLNTFDENSQLLVSPSIGIAYTIRKKAESSEE